MHADVVVIGAGLAGLACARALAAAGRAPLVLEAADQVGGRLATRRVDGHLLDRGFQVLLDSYPEARRQLDLEALDLHAFHPGARVRRAGRLRTLSDPRRRPRDAWRTTWNGVGSWADKLRILRLERRLRGATPSGSTADWLADQGFGEDMLEGFLRPFLAGVFLERELETDAARLAFVWNHFREGRACLPADGMAAIPRQLAAGLPADSVRLSARVESLEADHVVVDGARVQAEHVVLAVDEPAARRLLGLPAGHPGRHVTCLHFAAPTPPVDGPWLVLNGEGPADGPINDLCVPSEVAPGYAPADQAQVSVSVLGAAAREPDDALGAAVLDQLGRWFGGQVERWTCLGIDRVAGALPVATEREALFAAARARGVQLCGDHVSGPSIDQALSSGRALGERLAAPALVAPGSPS